MNATLKNQIEKTFARVFCEFRNPGEVYNFLKDFLTEKEFTTLSKRLSVVYWLTKKRDYSNIANNLEVSSAAITEAKNLMKKKNVYDAVKKIDADEWADKWSVKIKKLLTDQ